MITALYTFLGVNMAAEQLAQRAAPHSIVRTPVTSSLIASLGHDGESTLEIEFRNGAIYRYANVPPALCVAFLAAPSKGAFFIGAIKENPDYPYTLVQAAPPKPTTEALEGVEELDFMLMRIRAYEDHAAWLARQAQELREQVRATILQKANGATYRNDIATVSIPERRLVTIVDEEGLLDDLTERHVLSKYWGIVPEKTVVTPAHHELNKRFHEDAKAGFVTSKHVTVETVYDKARITWKETAE